MADSAVARVVEAVNQLEPSDPSDSSPQQIGPYHLLDQLGTGGMGVVYLAEQQHPIKRTVALKLIKPGMDSREVIARFESERQALAMMSHRNVAKVLDAGTSEEGRPYFVMEHVPGLPITWYCDEHRLTLRERLELFIQACEAVQHAHQKAIIHRDLKPSNILVTGENGDAEVKVIDFGVAKALSPGLDQRHTLYTHTGQLIGTPDYMSPEQASSDGRIVDTRSDIYSLGVVLYELLTGAQPFDPKTLRGSGVAEIQRIIREVDPPRPSTRLSTLGESASVIATNRHVQLHELTKQLRGELEWIPLKAMRKEPEQRYDSAGELADDIRNYLEHKPLLAGPVSRVYRLRKFVRRNKAELAITLAFVLMLSSGVALYIRGIRAEQAKTLAALKVAQTERETAVAVTDFLRTDILAGATPERLRDAAIGDVIVKAIVNPAAETVAQRFNEKPLTEAAVRHTLADVYLALGRQDLALPHAQQSLEMRRRLLPDDHLETVLSIDLVGACLQEQGRLGDAEAYFREGLQRSHQTLGPDHAHTLAAINNLAGLLKAQGRFGEAEPLYRESLDGCRRVHGINHPSTLNAQHNMGNLLHAQGKSRDAEIYLRLATEKRRELLGSDHPLTLRSINSLGVVLRDQGRFADAEPLFREVLETSRRVLGEEHPGVGSACHDVASILMDQGKLDEAAILFREALDRRSRSLGREHPDTLGTANSLAALLYKQGRTDVAEAMSRDTLEVQRRILGEEHPNTMLSKANLAVMLLAQDKFPEAEPYAREVLEFRRRTLGPNHPHTLFSLGTMGAVLVAQEQVDQAETHFREALEGSRRVLGDQHPFTLRSMSTLGRLVRDREGSGRAEPLLKELFDRAQSPQLSPPERAVYASQYPVVLADLRRDEEAEALLRHSYAQLAVAGLTESEPAREVVAALAGLCERTNRVDEAAEWQARLANVEATPHPTTAPATQPAD